LSSNLWKPQKLTDKNGQDISVLLEPFFTNLDESVFGIKNLPQMTMGALWSRFSRSDAADIRQVFADEFLSKEVKEDFAKNPEKVKDELKEFLRLKETYEFSNIERAKSFYKRVLAEFGDDSINYMVGAHIAMLNISSRASFETSDPRVGIEPITKSSRFVALDRKIEGEYQFYRDPKIMDSPFADQYIAAMNILFDTYSRLLAEMIPFLKEKVPIQAFSYKNQTLADIEKAEDDKKSEAFKRAYETAARAAALDTVRGLLPVSVLLNKGFRGNGFAFETLLNKMYASELEEMRTLGKQMKHELDLLIPESVVRVEDEKGVMAQTYLRESRNAVKEILWEAFDNYEWLGGRKEYDGKTLFKGKYITLVDADDNKIAEEKVFSGLVADMFPVTALHARDLARNLTIDEKENIIYEIVSRRKNRRHKLPRTFENTYYTMQWMIPLGEIRDLHRHKIQTRSMPQLTVKFGFDVPEEVVALGRESEYTDAIKSADDVFWKLFSMLPEQAGYAVTFAHKHPYITTFNLREADYELTLRSSQGSNPVYMRAAQEAYQAISSVHPTLAKAMNLVNLKSYDFGRFWSIMRSEEKKII
jgi:thymidylate synthase ThyX